MPKKEMADYMYSLIVHRCLPFTRKQPTEPETKKDARYEQHETPSVAEPECILETNNVKKRIDVMKVSLRFFLLFS